MTSIHDPVFGGIDAPLPAAETHKPLKGNGSKSRSRTLPKTKRRSRKAQFETTASPGTVLASVDTTDSDHHEAPAGDTPDAVDGTDDAAYRAEIASWGDLPTGEHLLDIIVSERERINALLEATRAPDWKPGAPFKKDNITALNWLKNTDAAEYEDCISTLRACGVRIGPLQQTIKALDPKLSGDAPAEILIDLINENVELFHDAAKSKHGYADLTTDDGVRHTYALNSQAFEQLAVTLFYGQTGAGPSKETINTAFNTIKAMASCNALARPVYLRTGKDEQGAIWIDLGKDDWNAVCITAAGWEVLAAPDDIRFRRSELTAALPMPSIDGDINALRPLLNVETDEDYVLTVGWILGAFSPSGPYPLLVVTGEQGTAKSTFTRLIKRSVDPVTLAELRSMPKDERDLMIAATNCHVLAFDNVSKISDEQSDILCRLATGGGYATRKLHTDDIEQVFDATRPVIMNGIGSIATRGDLIDRAIAVSLAPIPRDARKTQAEIDKRFEEALPRFLGAIFNAIAHGLREPVQLGEPPRLADFANWVASCEPALWPPGTFMWAYGASRDDADEDLLEADLVAETVLKFMDKRQSWQGSATELQDALEDLIPDRQKKFWPAGSNSLSTRLKRAAPLLKQRGVEFVRRATNGRRQICLVKPSGQAPFFVTEI
jgi:hypothetical protein